MAPSAKKATFLDTRYTLSFAVRFSGLALLFFSSFALVLFLSLNKRLGVSYFEDIATLSRLQEKLPLVLFVTAVVQAALGSFVVLILSLFWAHAVAGPLVRFRKYLRMAGRDEPIGGMSFRKSDQLQYLAEAFREMQARWTKRRYQMSLYVRQAKDLIAEYESLAKDLRGNSMALEEKRGALKEIYQKMLALLPEEKHS